jgi:hypothetical protein
MKKTVRLLTKQFVGYCAVLFLTFCNMAVFFQFNDCLTTLPIKAGWSGFLVGIFSLTVLAVRPVISPFLNAENDRFWILASSGGIIICLNLYSYGTTLGTIATVGILHGLAGLTPNSLVATIRRVPIPDAGLSGGVAITLNCILKGMCPGRPR